MQIHQRITKLLRKLGRKRKPLAASNDAYHFIKLLQKPDRKRHARTGTVPTKEVHRFKLMLDKLHVGNLSYEQEEWTFAYTDDFKAKTHEYHLIVGFPNVDATYKSRVLWPFFAIRIPGLQQPAIKQILEAEQIDPSDDLRLLKRFGRKTIANPFALLAVPQ